MTSYDESEDGGYCAYGSALPPLDEEEVVRKKPIPIEDQIVTDENGRRRFHGAFTGGFSAGYFNTAGSRDGWSPAHFKSSRFVDSSTSNYFKERIWSTWKIFCSITKIFHVDSDILVRLNFRIESWK